MRNCRGWAARSVLTVGAAALAVGGLPAVMAGATAEGTASQPAVVEPTPPEPEAAQPAPTPAEPAPSQPVTVSDPAPAAPSQPVTVQEPDSDSDPVPAAPSQPVTVSDPAPAAPSQPVTVQEPDSDSDPVPAAPSQPVTVEAPDPSPAPAPDPDPEAPSQPATVVEPAQPSPTEPGSADVPAPPAPEAPPALAPASEQAADGQRRSPSPAPTPTVPAGVAPAQAPTTADAGPTRTPRSAPSDGPTALWGSGHGAILSADWLGYLSLSGMTPSAYALEDIPTPMMDLYQAGTNRCPGLPWAVLAAVGKVETDHARNVAVSSAGARGPMQFMPATWGAFGMDADGDGRADVEDAEDAVFSAASYLCANGGGDPETLPEALYAYNHAWWYVHRVIGYAERYVGDDWDPTAPVGPVDRAALLDNPRLKLYPGGRADIAAGRIDGRVLDLLALLTAQHEITVVSLQTGHSMNVAGTNRVSNHFLGRAVDIAAIDGERVSATSPRARALVTWLASLVEGPQRPREVGSPFADLRSQPGHFTDAMHMGHVHIGWAAPHHD